MSASTTRPPDDVDWAYLCKPEQLAKLKTDPRFWQLLTLAKVVNAIRYVQGVELHDADKDESPAAWRRRWHSFFYSASVLYEGILLINAMVKTFDNSPAFENGLRAILRDPKAQELRDQIGELRNRGVFHFLPEVIGAALQAHPTDVPIFSRARGPMRGETWYEMADQVTVEMFVGRGADTPNFFEDAEGLMGSVTTLLLRYLNAATDLIREQLPQLGFKMQQLPSSLFDKPSEAEGE